jgi:predicted transposase YbfD/YdcC
MGCRWGIEGQLHGVRDVVYDEDRSQVRTGNGARVMTGLRNLAIAVPRLTLDAIRAPGRTKVTA